MYRASVVLISIAMGAAIAIRTPPVAWPLRASVSDLRGRPIAFRALSLGGDLVVRVGERPDPNRPLEPPIPILRTLAPGDTVEATTPATYPLDLAHGPVVFFTTGRDSLRVVVGRHPFGAIKPVTAYGRRLTVRQIDDSVVINAR
jgi:hypothetical protein